MVKPYSIDIWKDQCKDKEILDLGCGNGYLLEQIADTGFRRYLGIDISEKMIEENRKRFSGLERVEFRADDAEALNTVRDDSLDMVISNGCLHHLKEPEVAVAASYRVLRPGGTFLGLEMNRQHPENSFLSVWSTLLGVHLMFLQTPARRIVRYLENLVKKQDPIAVAYSNQHPGHPGKRTPNEYRLMFEKAGYASAKIESLYLELLPYSLYKRSLLLFRLVVKYSKIVCANRLKGIKDVGNLLLIEAHKR